ncbi:hypothetical protein LMB80_04035 [Limosilactobacillus reuteri]|nr:hypothetical protein [Limosilactobacillus reuteri]
MTIAKNADEVTGDVVSTITLDQFKKEIDDKVADAVKSIHIDPSTVNIDLSDYAKKTDIPAVPAIALDVDTRVLSIDDKQITIPASVDLSQYAKKSDLPSVAYDPTSHTLTVDGQTVDLPADVDLSNYYTKSEIDNKLVNLNTNQPVDLTAYVKKEDLADYARKADIPSVPEIVLDTEKRSITVDGQEIDIPSTVDLSQYAKKDDVPHIALDVNARKITLNGASINVPDSVNLTGYLTEQEGDAKYANKADVKDVSIDVANRTIKIGNDSIDVPDDVDLSGYAKTGDVPKVDLNAFTRTLTVNGQSVSIPATVDLTGYATKSDLSAYLTVNDADAKYAKKSDVENANKSNKDVVHVYKTDVDVQASIRNQTGISFNDLQCVFDGYSTKDAKIGDVVIDTTGSVYKVNKMYYQEVAVEKQPILKGNSLTKLSDYDKTQTQQMFIIAKEKVKSFLQMNDTDTYTLNIDECTLTDETTKATTKLVPAVYPLRDLNISNLSIKSKTNFGLKDGVRCNPVQLTITPHAVFANVVTSDFSAGGSGTTEQMFWHPVWLYDLSEWYGITEAWHKLP